MTDRELLELAAKAAGLILNQYPDEDFLRASHGAMGVAWNPKWNPITDDGDALRLAVNLGLIVDCNQQSAGEPFKPHAIWLDQTMSNAELTRRAIVRAAAEIGKAMS